jgi:putative flippase GtrA
MFFLNDYSILHKFFIKSSNRISLQFFRYIITGGISAVADISVFGLLANHLMFYPLLANTFSFAIGLIINYFMSRQWVFNNTSHKFYRDFFIFLITGVIGLGMSNIIIYSLIDLRVIYMLKLPLSTDLLHLMAKTITVGTVFIWNFASRKYIISKVINRA